MHHTLAKKNNFRISYIVHTPNDKYENFVTTHQEAAAKCILTKHNPNVEFLGVKNSMEKWDNLTKYLYLKEEIQPTPILSQINKNQKFC